MSGSLRHHGLHTRLPCLPEFAPIHVHRVSDSTQPSHPLLPPSPPAVSLAQHQDLFQRISSLHQVAKVLELQHQHFQWIFRVDFFLESTALISLLSKGLSGVFSSTTIGKHQFFGVQPSVWSNSHSHPYMTTRKSITLTRWTFVGKVMPLLFNMLSSFVVWKLGKLSSGHRTGKGQFSFQSLRKTMPKNAHLTR